MKNLKSKIFNKFQNHKNLINLLDIKDECLSCNYIVSEITTLDTGIKFKCFEYGTCPAATLSDFMIVLLFTSFYIEERKSAKDIAKMLSKVINTNIGD